MLSIEFQSPSPKVFPVVFIFCFCEVVHGFDKFKINFSPNKLQKNFHKKKKTHQWSPNVLESMLVKRLRDKVMKHHYYNSPNPDLTGRSPRPLISLNKGLVSK